MTHPIEDLAPHNPFVRLPTLESSQYRAFDPGRSPCAPALHESRQPAVEREAVVIEEHEKVSVGSRSQGGVTCGSYTGRRLVQVANPVSTPGGNLICGPALRVVVDHEYRRLAPVGGDLSYHLGEHPIKARRAPESGDGDYDRRKIAHLG
jgi:hypothetical protein